MITLFINVFLKGMQPMTDVLQNLTNTSSVFSWELFTAFQKELLLWYLYRMEWFSLSGAPNGMGHISTPVQNSTKKYEKVGKEILH